MWYAANSDQTVRRPVLCVLEYLAEEYLTKYPSAASVTIAENFFGETAD